jgi:RHS repeat-associated protein
VQQGQFVLQPGGAGNDAACQVAVERPSHLVYLLDDAAASWTAATIGSSGVLQNSRCRIAASQVTVTDSTATTWHVNTPVTFTPAFTGVRLLYATIFDVSWYTPGWELRGGWTVQCNVSPEQTRVPASAGAVTISVLEPCPWSVPAATGFLTADGATTGNGGDAVTFSYPRNTGGERVSDVSIAGRTVTVTQAANDQLPGGEEMVYYHTDAIGSVRLVTDANGASLRAHDFLPFGESVVGSNQSTDAFMYAGHERDAGAASDYFGARFYQSFSERFASPDPLPVTGERVLKPYRLNRYTYANDNPFSFVDPDGLDSGNIYFDPDCDQSYVTVWICKGIELGMALWRVGIGFGENFQSRPPAPGGGAAVPPSPPSPPKLKPRTAPVSCRQAYVDRVERLNDILDDIEADRKIRDPETPGLPIAASNECTIFGPGKFDYSIRIEDPKSCLLQCSVTHENVHRQQCAAAANSGKFAPTLSFKQAERPAYMTELGCVLNVLQGLDEKK